MPAMPKNSSDALAGNSKYRSVRELGQGAFGKVQLAVNLATGEQVAIKFVERGHGITKFVAREVMNHSKLLHPHIVQFKEVLLTPVHLGIVLEYAAGGDMFQHVKRSGGLEEADARWFYQQLMIALDYMHSLGVSNRDVKLENTLLDGSRRPLLKLCDFGYSKADTDSLPKSVVGTPGYTAPEVLSNGRTYDGTKCDVWSSAVMLYVMLFCEYPFERPEDEQHPHKFQKMLERTKRLDYRFPKSIPVSQSCKDFIKSILVLEPSQRPSVQQVQAHPWYRTDLPAGVASMNEECLKLRGFTAGHQTEEEIRSIIREAMQGPNNSNGFFQDAFDEEIAFR